MDNNQKKIQDCQSNEWFSIENTTSAVGIWKVHQYSAQDDGYEIEEIDGTRIWVLSDTVVTLVAIEGKGAQQEEQAWADIKLTEECMKEEEKWRPVPNMSQEEYDKMRESKELPDMSDYHMYTSVQETGLEIMVKAAEEGKMKIVVEGTPFPDNSQMMEDYKYMSPEKFSEKYPHVRVEDAAGGLFMKNGHNKQHMKEELKINTDSGEHPISNFTYVEWDKTMKEETAVQSDMGILEKWVEMEKSQPNIFKEANERIEKQAQETMDKLRKGEKVTWAAAYKDAGVKDPMEAGIEATIKGLTDMPTSRTVPIWNDRDVEGEPGRVPDSDDEGYGASMYLQDESAIQSKEVVPVYNSLEEITEHLQGIKNSEYKYSRYFNWQDCIQVAIEKLQNTISSGYYINTKPTE